MHKFHFTVDICNIIYNDLFQVNKDCYYIFKNTCRKCGMKQVEKVSASYMSNVFHSPFNFVKLH